MTCTACGTSNPAGMRFCGMCGSPLEQQRAPRERRRVSVIFIDLAAFSTLTHGFDPEELRDLADEVLTVVAGIIEDYDGYVDAFRGDGLIALFGAPHSHPDDPQRAVLAAAAGLEAIERVGASKGTPLKGRAGVNTGIVIAGSVGSGRVRDYTVMGSAVNLAARLEAAAQPGEVWVGTETFEATRHRLSFEKTGPVVLAGFPNITEVYRLISTRQPRNDDPFGDLAFVGRTEEMAQMNAAYAGMVADGAARELWLIGEAGSGKSRLLREFLAGLDPERSPTLTIESNPTESYSWGSLARQIFDLQDGEDAAVRRRRVTTQLQRLLPGEPRWHQLILTSLNMAEEKPWTRLERRTVDRANLAWRDLLTALARQTDVDALIITVENEPQDSPLLSFLEVVRQTEAPILVVRTSRGRGLLSEESTIPLRPLSIEESMALLDQLASPILRVAAESLAYQVGGIPAYILELGQALTITQEVSFSGSLASLLQARLDMVEVSARRLLAHTALAGERCWEGLLRELGEGDTHEQVELLSGANLLLRQVTSGIPGETEYRFQSELLRHAALRMIPFKERPLLHLRIATWLEQHAPLSFSESTADHFQRGGSSEAAFAHLLAAADLAISTDDIERAFAFYEQLLTLEVEVELLAQGALVYAQTAAAAGRHDLACDRLTTARTLIDRCEEETRDNLHRVHEHLSLEIGAPSAPPNDDGADLS
jgi:class 3 adenylate cyclase